LEDVLKEVHDGRFTVGGELLRVEEVPEVVAWVVAKVAVVRV